MMRKNYLISLIFLIFLNSSIQVKSNQLSSSAELYLITVTPGSQLYSMFGHSALRFYDSIYRTDITFNYGTFDPSEKFFVFKFLKGSLNYYLSKTSFSNVLLEAYYENRSVYQNKLNITHDDLIKLYNYLDSLYYADYKYCYRFFKNNCATKIRDIVNKCYNDSISFPEYNSKITFRDCLKPYLKDHLFFGTGINILLGRNVDMNTSFYDRMFLPDTLMAGFLEGTYKELNISEPLQSIVILEKEKNSLENILACIFSTFLILLFLFIFYKQLSKRKYSIEYSIIILLTSITGIIILTMWLLSDHIEVKNNFNILWANPLFLFYFFLRKKSKQLNFLKFFILLCYFAFFILAIFRVQIVPFFVIIITFFLTLILILNLIMDLKK